MQSRRQTRSKPGRYPDPLVVYVDVDGTLIQRAQLNHHLVDWLRVKRADGYALILWSARGADYARRIAIEYRVLELFDQVLSKPGIIVDDLGEGWARYIKHLAPSYNCTPAGGSLRRTKARGLFASPDFSSHKAR